MTFKNIKLYNMEKNTTTEYIFSINNYEIFDPPPFCPSKVSIIFVNKKFSHCLLPFAESYTLEQWGMLKVIADKITEILEGDK